MKAVPDNGHAGRDLGGGRGTGARQADLRDLQSGTQQYFIDQAAGFTAAEKEFGYDARTINVEIDTNVAISAMSAGSCRPKCRHCRSAMTAPRRPKKKLALRGASGDAVKVVAYDRTTHAALTAAGPVITANPGVNKWAVVACNDEGALGTTNALKNAGIAPADVIAVGLGSYAACGPWKEGIASGVKAALHHSGVDLGDAVARALINAIENRQLLPEKDRGQHHHSRSDHLRRHHALRLSFLPTWRACDGPASFMGSL